MMKNNFPPGSRLESHIWKISIVSRAAMVKVQKKIGWAHINARSFDDTGFRPYSVKNEEGGLFSASIFLTASKASLAVLGIAFHLITFRPISSNFQLFCNSVF